MEKLKFSYVFYIVFGLTLLKILLIDIDPPQWSVAFYQPIDESYYAYRALNLYEYGNAFFTDESIRVYGAPMLTNTMTYIFLHIFGDNYFGFRFSSIFFSTVTVVLFYFILTRITKNKFLLIGLPCFLAFNFNFSLASIFVEPTISRIAIMMVAIFVTSRLNRPMKQLRSVFLWGVCSAILVIITYPTNAFMLAGAGLSLLILVFQGLVMPKSKRVKNLIVVGFTYGFGVILGVGIFLILTNSFGINELANFSQRNEVFSYRVSNSWELIGNNLTNIGWANLFTFNPTLFVLTASSIFFVWVRQPKSWSTELTIGYCFLLALLIQTAFLNDYAQRKLIIVLPLALLVMAGAIENITSEANFFSKRKKIVLKILGLMIMIGVAFVFVNTFIPEYKQMTTTLSFICMYMFVIIGSMQIVLGRPRLVFIILSVTLISIPEIINIKSYFIENRTYHYRNAFIKLREYDGKEFVGGFSMGFRLYNNIRASLNLYTYDRNPDLFWVKTGELAKANPDKTYSIGYKSQDEEYKKIGFYPIKVLIKADEAVDNADIVIYEERSN
jgi:hypothetical protein